MENRRWSAGGAHLYPAPPRPAAAALNGLGPAPQNQQVRRWWLEGPRRWLTQKVADSVVGWLCPNDTRHQVLERLCMSPFSAVWHVAFYSIDQLTDATQLPCPEHKWGLRACTQENRFAPSIFRPTARASAYLRSRLLGFDELASASYSPDDGEKAAPTTL